MKRLRIIARELRRLFFCCGAVFIVLFAVWTGSEGRHPGTQYPDPWLPCLALAVSFGLALWTIGRALHRPPS